MFVVSSQQSVLKKLFGNYRAKSTHIPVVKMIYVAAGQIRATVAHMNYFYYESIECAMLQSSSGV